MPNETLNFNLKKPTPSEFYDVQVSNENMDKIDSALKELDDKTDDLGTASGGIQQQVNNNTNAIQTLEQTLSEHQAHTILHIHYGIDTGAANGKVVTLNPAPTEYVDGMALTFKNNVQNTGAVTINVNGLGAKSILKSNGNALSSGNLKAGIPYTLRYNGTNFILQGEGGEYGTAQANHVLAPHTLGTENGIVTGTMVDRGLFNLPFGAVVPAGYYSGGVVPAGLRFASGVINIQGYSINVTGLAFRPKFIGIIYEGNTGMGHYARYFSFYCEDGAFNLNTATTRNTADASFDQSRTSGNQHQVSARDIIVTDNSFALNHSMNWNTTYANIRWYAFG